MTSQRVLLLPGDLDYLTQLGIEIEPSSDYCASMDTPDKAFSGSCWYATIHSVPKGWRMSTFYHGPFLPTDRSLRGFDTPGSWLLNRLQTSRISSTPEFAIMDPKGRLQVASELIPSVVRPQMLMNLMPINSSHWPIFQSTIVRFDDGGGYTFLQKGRPSRSLVGAVASLSKRYKAHPINQPLLMVECPL